MSSEPSAELKETPLTSRHMALGARMVPFAGWYMPVQYQGIIHEHNQVRTKAGLFDLGHMGQVDVAGDDAEAFLQYITTNDVSLLGPGDAQYSMLPNPRGGVVDDIIIYKRPSGVGYMVVTNASNHDKDFGWMQRVAADRPELKVELKDISPETGMIAIQGPNAEAIVQKLTNADLSHFKSFSWGAANVAGIDSMAARTGYTGEDGFEIYTPIERTAEVWDALLAAGAAEGLEPIGLGARDTLRLEARMPLYGNELGDDISPLEAGLSWAVKVDKGDFIGRQPIAAMKANGVPRKTVGFKLTERGGSPRSHYDVVCEGKPCGYVTSGAFSPTLSENIGLALVDASVAGVGKPLQVIIRDKPVEAVQVTVPFYKRDK